MPQTQQTSRESGGNGSVTRRTGTSKTVSSSTSRKTGTNKSGSSSTSRKTGTSKSERTGQSTTKGTSTRTAKAFTTQAVQTGGQTSTEDYAFTISFKLVCRQAIPCEEIPA